MRNVGVDDNLDLHQTSDRAESLAHKEDKPLYARIADT